MLTRRILAIAIAAATVGVLGAGRVEARHPDQISCQPLTTCGDEAAGIEGAECPEGYACVCVPSCPDCRDCATRVCVAVETACHSACDCPPGMGCADGTCRRTNAPVYCCDGEECPAGARCEDRLGQHGVCQRECRTACDCDPGLGCFEGQCIAGVAPVFCCEGEQCPAGDQCQHRDGRMDRCEEKCVDQAWLCDETAERRCGDGRVCACSASCPDCEDCGAGVCMPPDSPTPYRCDNDGTCAQPGDKCICVSSCPACDDCAINVCVPDCDNDANCERRLRMSQRRIDRVIDKTQSCRADDQCVKVDTSTGCQGTCGEYINRRWARRVQNFIGNVDARYCTGYKEDGCAYATPACLDTIGACVRGMCTGVPAPAVRPVPRSNVSSPRGPLAPVR